MSGRVKSTTARVLRYENDFVPIKMPQYVDYDQDIAEQMLIDSLDHQDIRFKSPIGRCYDCGKQVSGDRKVCGHCLIERNRKRNLQ